MANTCWKIPQRSPKTQKQILDVLAKGFLTSLDAITKVFSDDLVILGPKTSNPMHNEGFFDIPDAITKDFFA